MIHSGGYMTENQQKSTERKERLKKLSVEIRELIKKRHALIRELQKTNDKLESRTNERLTLYQSQKI